MPSIYLVDEINIISQTADEWGKVTETVVSGVAARVENEDRWVMDSQGNMQLSKTLVIVESDAVINWNSKIQIAKRAGVAETQADKKWPIKSLHRGEGFTASHWEVRL